MFAGLAGGIHAVTLASLGDNSYPAAGSLVVFSMAVIGGVSSLGGTLAGVALIQWLGYAFPRFQLLLTGVGLLVILMVIPGGLGQALEKVRDRFAAAVARRRGIPLVDELELVDLTAESPEQEAAVAALAVEKEERELARPPGIDAADGVVPDGAAARHAAGWTSGYGPVQVLFGVDFDVRRGRDRRAARHQRRRQVDAASRRSTGLLPAAGGHGHLRRRRHHRHCRPSRSPGGASSMMPGGTGRVPDATVAENLRLATLARCRPRPGRGAERGRPRPQCCELFPVLAERMRPDGRQPLRRRAADARARPWPS